MSSFNAVVKYLRLTKVDKITLEQAAAANQLSGSSNPLKYLTQSPARAIQRVKSSISIPAYNPDVLPELMIKGRMIAQWSFTETAPFFILNAPIKNRRQYGVLTVRYRVGEEVHRYAVYGNQLAGIGSYDLVYFPWYSNQIIEPSCVFEYWFTCHPLILEGTQFGLPVGYTINTSLLVEPTSADDLGLIAATDGRLDIPDLGNNLPEAIPTPQDNLVYLSN